MADSIIQDIMDPLILQPASLDLATLKKRAGDNLVSVGGTDFCNIAEFWTLSVVLCREWNVSETGRIVL
jgi:hypothetical protein